MLELTSFAVFFGIGIIAGIIEASAGGSGLISLPAILSTGCQPIQALATSKFQYAFGALTSIVHFSRAELIDWRRILPMLLGAVASGAAGAYALLQINTVVLEFLMPVLLLGIAVYMLRTPRISDHSTSARISYFSFGMFVAPLIAFYDGFFGVGSASIYVAAFTYFLGLSAREATANTKLLDFAGGLSALVVLALKGHVLVLPGLALGCGQILGANIGAKLVVRHGARWVRPALVIITIALSLRMLLKHANPVLR